MHNIRILSTGYQQLPVTVAFHLQGATWPAIHPMTARWIPPTERSKFMSNMMGKSRSAVGCLFHSGASAHKSHRYSCLCASLIEHLTMNGYGGVGV
jgi:hypothetical protein